MQGMAKAVVLGLGLGLLAAQGDAQLGGWLKKAGDAAKKAEDLAKKTAKTVDKLDGTAQLALRAQSIEDEFYADAPVPDFAALRHDAELAQHAYDDRETLDAFLGERGHVTEWADELVGLQSYTLDEGDRQTVVVRGTVLGDLRNWIVNASYELKASDRLGIEVHEGYLRASETLAVLGDALDKRRPVHLVGHSLGGSLAVLLGLQLRKLGYTVSVVTFGQPKVTNLDAILNQKSVHRLDLWRVVTPEDPMPALPPYVDHRTRREYVHFGRELVLDARGGSDQPGFKESLLASAVPVRQLASGGEDAHAMPIYIERLQALAAEDGELASGDEVPSGEQAPRRAGESDRR